MKESKGKRKRKKERKKERRYFSEVDILVSWKLVLGIRSSVLYSLQRAALPSVQTHLHVANVTRVPRPFHMKALVTNTRPLNLDFAGLG